MTHLSVVVRLVRAVALGATVLVGAATPAEAQCTSCGSPVVAAYQPAVTAAYAPAVTTAYQPVVTYQPYTGWYPGRLLDRMRMSRWGVATTTAPVYAAAAPAYTASYAPYTASYPAEYTAAYAPAYTASYAPYVTAYAPLQRAVTTTSYMPVATADGCSSCAQASYAPVVTTSYAPVTSYRPVLLRPVVEMAPVVTEPACPACSDGCTTCGMPAPCSACAAPAPCSACGASAPGSACSSCGSDVGQAIYTQPSSGCSSCAAGAGTPSYTPQSSVPAVGPVTPQPQLGPNEPTPASPRYPTNRPTDAPATSGSQGTIDPAPAADDASGKAGAFDAPRLLSPGNDRTASRPSVDVRTAVYRGPAPAKGVGAAAHGVATETHKPSQQEIDAQGWAAVPATR